MRVLVCGDRNWKDRDMIFATLDAYHALANIDEIIEGCATGADEFAGDHIPLPWRRFHGGWAWANGIPARHFPADWDNLGKRAGPIRNSQMLVEGNPEIVFAFHDDLFHSKGTGDMVKKAEKAGVTVVKITHPKKEDEEI